MHSCESKSISVSLSQNHFFPLEVMRAVNFGQRVLAWSSLVKLVKENKIKTCDKAPEASEGKLRTIMLKTDFLPQEANIAIF